MFPDCAYIAYWQLGVGYCVAFLFAHFTLYLSFAARLPLRYLDGRACGCLPFAAGLWVEVANQLMAAVYRVELIDARAKAVPCVASGGERTATGAPTLSRREKTVVAAVHRPLS